MKRKITFLLCLSFFFVVSTYAQVTSDTIYVDPSATGLNDGSSWANAYTNIVTAVGDAVVNGNTDVWVKQGTYVAPDSGDYTFLSMNNGVHLYGGFDGTETILNQRDPINNPTILSGDVNQDDVPLTSVVVALDDVSRSDNNYSVITARPAQNALARPLKVDGFTITGGNSRSTTQTGVQRTGGGIYVNPASGAQLSGFNAVEIENCIFENNSAYFGSAIHAETVSNYPTLTVIENCIFRNNFSQGNVVGTTGDHKIGTLITNCLFTENTVTHASVGLVTSGSLNSVAQSIVNITNSTFANNSITSGNVFTVYAPSVPSGDTIPTQLNVYNSIISETTAGTLIRNYGSGVADTITIRNNVCNTGIFYSGGFANGTLKNNTVSATPGFVGGGNYALANGSVAINHGTWADYNLWYNDPAIQFSSPATGLGGNPMSITAGNINAGAYQGGTTGINENELQSLVLNLYPNPTQTQLNIELNEAANLQIINLLGETLVTKEAVAGNNTIDVSYLDSGVYFLQVGNKGAVKIVKE